MGYVFDAMNRSNKPASDLSETPPGFHDLPPADLGAERTPVNFKFTTPSRDSDGGEQVISLDLEGIDDRLVAITEPSSVMAEEYRALRTNLLAKWEHRHHIVHTITSATPQEGKTITSLNLGLIFAELRNRRTIVIEGDLRLPQFQKLLNLPDSAGLVGVLGDDADLASSIHHIGETSLDVLCAGRSINREAVQLLEGGKMTALLKFLRREYDHIIIDTPPVVELADAGILGSMSDEVLLVARMNRTPKALIEQAVRTLAGYNAPVTGLIATDQSQNRHRYYYYRYGYRYYSRYSQRKAA